MAGELHAVDNAAPVKSCAFVESVDRIRQVHFDLELFVRDRGFRAGCRPSGDDGEEQNSRDYRASAHGEIVPHLLDRSTGPQSETISLLPPSRDCAGWRDDVCPKSTFGLAESPPSRRGFAKE